MKKRLAFLVALMVMTTCFFTAALAEDGDVPVIELGEGGKEIAVLVSVNGEIASIYLVSTDQKMLMAALEEVELIETEKASWGYNVTTVGDVKADYDGKGEYWSIAMFDEEQEDFVKLETAIDETVLGQSTMFGFILQK